MLWANLLFFGMATAILFFSGIRLVKSLVVLSRHFRVQEFTIGFIVMAVATSLPELFVGIAAAFQKNTSLALGNVIGSNIVDLTLIAGIGIVLVRSYPIKTQETKRDAFFMVGMALLPLVLMFIGGQISRLDGAVLIVGFVGYIYHLLRRRRYYPKKFVSPGKKRMVWHAFLSLASLAGLMLGAHYVVKYGTFLAAEFGFSSLLLGLFMIALATSLPELVFETTAILKRHAELALGDLIGSVIVNSSLVLGVTALIYPISADYLLALSTGVFMLLVCFVFATFIELGQKLHWKQGITLIFLYIFFVILELFIKP
ncbi:sodium:calcium antiporter [Candidatus Woesearchaeota archaeon]|nr:sodium:calcium antiporter [Candidatus Woesearchaeota archaeon]